MPETSSTEISQLCGSMQGGEATVRSIVDAAVQRAYAVGALNALTRSNSTPLIGLLMASPKPSAFPPRHSGQHSPIGNPAARKGPMVIGELKSEPVFHLGEFRLGRRRLFSTRRNLASRCTASAPSHLPSRATTTPTLPSSDTYAANSGDDHVKTDAERIAKSVERVRSTELSAPSNGVVRRPSIDG